MTQEIGVREVFTRITSRLDTLERRQEGLERALGELGDDLRREIAVNFRWTIGILLGTSLPMWVTIIITILLK